MRPNLSSPLTSPGTSPPSSVVSRLSSRLVPCLVSSHPSSALTSPLSLLPSLVSSLRAACLGGGTGSRLLGQDQGGRSVGLVKAGKEWVCSETAFFRRCACADRRVERPSSAEAVGRGGSGGSGKAWEAGSIPSALMCRVVPAGVVSGASATSAAAAAAGAAVSFPALRTRVATTHLGRPTEAPRAGSGSVAPSWPSCAHVLPPHCAPQCEARHRRITLAPAHPPEGGRADLVRPNLSSPPIPSALWPRLWHLGISPPLSLLSPLVVPHLVPHLVPPLVFPGRP